MPGTSSEIVTDPLKTYPDQALIAKIAADLSTQFQYGWLEHYFEGFLSETLEKLVVDHHKTLKGIAEQLAVDVLVYLTNNKLI
jgi:hypothetical protein|tara:strand:+ start:491 stop:739 length:249 start_codon:yes stop_codon:yes gene_type:complete